MKFGGDSPELDAIDLQIIALLQEHGRIPLVKLGEQVGLSAPSVNERQGRHCIHRRLDRASEDNFAVRGIRRTARRRPRMPSRHR